MKLRHTYTTHSARVLPLVARLGGSHSCAGGGRLIHAATLPYVPFHFPRIRTMFKIPSLVHPSGLVLGRHGDSFVSDRPEVVVLSCGEELTRLSRSAGRCHLLRQHSFVVARWFRASSALRHCCSGFLSAHSGNSERKHRRWCSAVLYYTGGHVESRKGTVPLAPILSAAL